MRVLLDVYVKLGLEYVYCKVRVVVDLLVFGILTYRNDLKKLHVKRLVCILTPIYSSLKQIARVCL